MDVVLFDETPPQAYPPGSRINPTEFHQITPPSSSSLSLIVSFKDWNDWIRIAKTRVFGSSSTVVVVQSYLLDFQLAQGHWYRSRGIQPGDFPFGLNMLNKKWTLEEEYNRHIYQFQQVNINSINKRLTSYPRLGC